SWWTPLLKSAHASRIMRLRRPTAHAVRVSVLVEAPTSIRALSQKAAGGFEPPIESLQGTCLSHLATPPFKEQERVASWVCRPSFAALSVFKLLILLISYYYEI